MNKRHWWITGAGSGIGRELARLAVSEGDRVTISGRRRDALIETADDHAAMAVQPLDVTDPAAVDAAIDTIERLTGPIDVAVLNAALYQQMDTPDFDRDVIRRLHETNVMGVVNCLQPLLLRMQARGSGRIVIVASVAGYRGLPKAAAYGPTKAALINLAEALRPSAEAAGITLQIVNPGFVETPMTAVNRFPMPFLLTPEKAAARIMAGTHGNRFEIAFPWTFVMLLKLARLLPYRLYFALTKRML
ncbi:SDR family NAD(P)-dependent oxidoreductase [Dongia sp.]|uniref:SDR family NAD(P)-dependent oxidoreductase n=1 Tax=Dongia sp. TaxID=1977262 RepID=UPI0035AD956D